MSDERDDRRPPRRVRVPERDHGAAGARRRHGWGSGSASGRVGRGLAARAVGVAADSGTASRSAWWRPVARDPPHRRRRVGRRRRQHDEPAQVLPGVSPPASRYCSTYLPFALLNATTRWFASSYAYSDPLRRLDGRRAVRRRDHRVVRVRADAPSAGGSASQPEAGMTRATLAVLGDVDVAVDEHVGHAARRRARWAAAGWAGRVAEPSLAGDRTHDVLRGRVDDVQLVERRRRSWRRTSRCP